MIILFIYFQIKDTDVLQMNKQSISKLNLFLIGLSSRFQENNNIFKDIKITYRASLKSFNGIGKYTSGNIEFNFNGKKENISINELINKICNDAASYASLSLIYSKRGADILIEADNKNVKIKNIEIKVNEEKDSHDLNETSTLLNRNYYIKVGKADALLKEIGIMTKEGKVKNDKIR